MSPVADKRSSFFSEGRYDDLSLLSVRKHLACCRVNYFAVDEVIEIVHPCMFRTVDSYAGTVYFSKPVNVKELYAQALIDAVTHFISPSFRSKNTFFQFDLALHLPAVDLFGKKEPV
ncbi:hypothetical protein SDC9_179009 [bioreactor metagenome]|uniref:Uncharacterized protein n=1 Tax=bioreactor metagenome TaxID=1076179 RepID=A0A645GXK5_9ZZZZ